jgi:preprotein translocase subunit YajC
MQQLLHSEQELQATLRRAQEIAEAGNEQTVPAEPELETYIRSAEEAGIPREAFILAMQERMQAPLQSVQVGDRVFAPSADEALYVATVTAVDGQAITVKFESGGEHRCSITSLQTMSLMPGRKLEYRDKTWGWTSGKVHKVDADKGRVKIDNDWSVVDVKLHDIRVPRTKTQREQRVSRIVGQTALIAGSLGTALGWLLHMWLR